MLSPLNTIKKLLIAPLLTAFVLFAPIAYADTEDVDTSKTEPSEEVVQVSCDNLRGLDRALCRTGQQIIRSGEVLPTCMPGDRNTSRQRAYCMIKSNKERQSNADKKISSRAAQRSLRVINVNKAKNLRKSTSDEADKQGAEFEQNVRSRIQSGKIGAQEFLDTSNTRRQQHFSGRQNRRQAEQDSARTRLKEKETSLRNRTESVNDRRARQRAAVNDNIVKKREATKQDVRQRATRKNHLEERRARAREAAINLRAGAQNARETRARSGVKHFY